VSVNNAPLDVNNALTKINVLNVKYSMNYWEIIASAGITFLCMNNNAIIHVHFTHIIMILSLILANYVRMDAAHV